MRRNLDFNYNLIIVTVTEIKGRDVSICPLKSDQDEKEASRAHSSKFALVHSLVNFNESLSRAN